MKSCLKCGKESKEKFCSPMNQKEYNHSLHGIAPSIFSPDSHSEKEQKLIDDFLAKKEK